MIFHMHTTSFQAYETVLKLNEKLDKNKLNRNTNQGSNVHSSQHIDKRKSLLVYDLGVVVVGGGVYITM